MSDDMNTLSDDERVELEQLRREKQQREAQERAAAERAELEQLRSEHARLERDLAQERQKDRHIAEARSRGARLMQPDEDNLTMPLGQKIVILVVVLLAVLFFIASYVVH